MNAPDPSTSNPLETLRAWYELAARVRKLPEAMALATATADGSPSVRMVLWRGWDGEAPCFYTNHESRKGLELAENPRAAAVIWWPELDAQVRLEGEVYRLSAEISDTYFASRPRDNQLSAAVSPQSQPIASLAALSRARDALEQQLGASPVPRPANWGGYGLTLSSVELWREGAGRLHRRWRYTRAGEAWRCELLAP